MEQQDGQDQNRSDRNFDSESRNAGTSNDPSHHAPESGITNRPIKEEEENQQRLPPRGEARGR